MKSFIFLAILFFFVSCNESDEIAGTGYVRFINLEGGFYGIISDNGNNYLPQNLKDEFKQDSLHVSFKGIITDEPTVQQWGRTIMLTKIEKIF